MYQNSIKSNTEYTDYMKTLKKCLLKTGYIHRVTFKMTNREEYNFKEEFKYIKTENKSH